MSHLIGHSFGDPPYNYERGEEITVVFRTDPDVLEAVLPPVLKPLGSRSLAVVRVMRHARSTFGPTPACTSVRRRSRRSAGLPPVHRDEDGLRRHGGGPRCGGCR